MRLTDPAQLTVGGEFALRLRRALEHLKVLNQAEMRRELTHPDDKWHWGADYMGRWLGVMARLGEHTHQDYGCDQVARELRGRESTRSTVILALTGYGQPEDRARGQEAGFNDHLTKPVDPARLMKILRATLIRALDPT